MSENLGQNPNNLLIKAALKDPECYSAPSLTATTGAEAGPNAPPG